MLGSGVLAWLRLIRVFQKIDRIQTIDLKRYDLNAAQFDVLAQVGSHQGITQQKLADHLLVTKGNISQLIDRMEKRGLLRRCQERRSNALLLTPAGQALYDRVVPAHEELISRQMAGLNEREIGELLRLLRKLDHSL